MRKKPLAIGILFILFAVLSFFVFYDFSKEKTGLENKPTSNDVTRNATEKPDGIAKNEPSGTRDSSQSPIAKNNPLRFKFIPGTQIVEKFDYNFSNDSHFEIKLPDQTGEEKTLNNGIRCSGEMIVTCYKAEQNKSFLGYKLRNFFIAILLESKEADVPQSIKDDFDGEIFLEKNSLGEIEGLYFSNLNGLVKNFWQQVIQAQHLVFSQDHTEKWIYKGDDSLGTYLASFEKVQPQDKSTLITREIKNYASIKFESGEKFSAGKQTKKISKDNFKINILESKAKYFFDPERGYPIKIALADSAELQVKTDFKFSSAYKTVWNSEVKETTQINPKELMDRLSAKWGTSDIAQLKQKMEQTTLGRSFAAEPIHTEEEKTKAQERFVEILGMLKAMDENWDAKAVSKLFHEASELAKISPKILDLIALQMKEPGTIQIKGFLADILADVGDQKAQEIMKSFITDPALEESVRERVIFSAAFVTSPEGFFRDTMVATFKSSPDNSESKLLALRTLGAMAHKFKDSNPDIAQQMLLQFSSYKQKASTVDEKMAFIDAVGNTHLDNALPFLTEYLDKPEPVNVRMAAMNSIAGTDSETALNLAITKIETSSYENQVVSIAFDAFLRRHWEGCSEKSRNMAIQLAEQVIVKYKDDENIVEMARKLRQKLLK